MRITEVVTKLSLQTSDKEALEEEFRRLTKQLRELENQLKESDRGSLA